MTTPGRLRVVAPGKLMLTGSYAVLGGAPALVCAVARYAFAGGPSAGDPSADVAAALGGESPGVDVSAFSRGGQKLGLGSSAAAVVAALAYRAASRGDDLSTRTVRDAIFHEARAAHARVQGGGSGVDIAASVHGGVLRYTLDAHGHSSALPVELPAGLRIDAYWSGRSARTSDMRALVDALRPRAPDVFAQRMRDLDFAAVAAVSAVLVGDARAFLEAARSGERALSALGRDADAPIVIPEARPLVPLADEEGATFSPSGAGGGDVFVRLGLAPPSSRFDASACAAGFERLPLELDALGVRIEHGLGESHA